MYHGGHNVEHFVKADVQATPNIHSEKHPAVDAAETHPMIGWQHL
jgi:hypothetical protein